MNAWLTTLTGMTVPAHCELFPEQATSLGRHASNTIVLRDEHASRWHALLLWEQERWYLKNIGSPVNGTRVNDVLVEGQTSLAHNQIIAIGSTRLRFQVRPEATAAPVPATPLQTDDLAFLCAFLAHAVEETDPRLLIRHALESAVQHTRATVAGFLGLDPAEPLPKLLWPESAQVDVQLSRHLTQQVQREGRAVWLAGGRGSAPLSDSLGGYTDALCVPLRVAATALGALHLYRTEGLFNDRHLRFCEVLASYLASSLHALRARRSLEAENTRLRGQLPALDDIIGSSAAMTQLRHMIARVAPRSSVVLIRGESGVGKELVALAVHRQSQRRGGPLVVVNCAAITATLPEAELFGHCRGAFTGADRDRPGLFQQADEGTLFLDEVGELPLDCQAKLLRVLEGHGFRPVGATAEVRADVRIIAATNRDLDAEATRGRFRRDLLYRLQVLQIVVPPLREHPEDIPALVQSFVAKLSRDWREPVQLTPAALQRLRGYAWPGNVRQLRAVLENALVLSDRPVLDAADLPLPSGPPPGAEPPLQLAELEDWAIRQALRRTGGNITRAALLLGVVRDTLAGKMKRRGIARDVSPDQ